MTDHILDKVTLTLTQTQIRQRKITPWVKLSDSGNPKDNGPVYGYSETFEEEKEVLQILKMEINPEIDVSKLTFDILTSLNNMKVERKLKADDTRFTR